MEDAIRELVAEQGDVNKRIGRLHDMIENEELMDSMGRERASLVRCQYEALKSYNMTLAGRILIELEEGNVSLEEVSEILGK